MKRKEFSEYEFTMKFFLTGHNSPDSESNPPASKPKKYTTITDSKLATFVWQF